MSQTALAWAICSIASPVAPMGKNSPGSVFRHADWLCHVRVSKDVGNVKATNSPVSTDGDVCVPVSAGSPQAKPDPSELTFDKRLPQGQLRIVGKSFEFFLVGIDHGVKSET